MLRKSFLRILPLCVLAACLLCACAHSPEPAQTETTVEAVCTARFWIGAEPVGSETVRQGQAPLAAFSTPEGLTISSWRDSAGNTVDPASIALDSDADYYAMAYPALSVHAPYLFADESGLLRPEQALTTADFTEALTALSTEAARAYFPEMPTLVRDMDAEELRSGLAFFFPEERVRAAFDDCEGTVTRAEFAAGMNALLGRGGAETLLFTGTVQLFADLGTDTARWGDLLEAALAHEPRDDGQTLSGALLQAHYPSGFFNVSGWLYYADESGLLARDTDVGVLHFDENGRYTSGDAELDAIVAEILDGIIRDNPDLTGLELLRKAFEYSRDSFMYLRKEPFAFGATGWETESAKQMFQTGLGNCYNYAASFWALARGLGYEAVAISGTMTGTYQPHSWVEIPWEGQMWICDPEEEMVYRTERGIFDMDMFFVTYEEGTYWTYVRP